MSGMPVGADREARLLSALAEPDFLPTLCGRMLGSGGEYESWGSVCRSLDIPSGRVMGWLVADAKRYEVFHSALRMQRELLADDAAEGVDEMVAIADATGPDDVAVSKLRNSARKDRAEFRTALAAVMTPERYGRVRAVSEAVTVAPDAALLGFASDLLRLVAARGAVPQSERVVEGESERLSERVL